MGGFFNRISVAVPSVERRLVIDRNPDPDSTLPFLLRLPVQPAGLVLAHDAWPRTAKIHCYFLGTALAGFIEQPGRPE